MYSWTIDKEKFEANPENYHKVAQEDIITYLVGTNEWGVSFHSFINRKITFKANEINKNIFLYPCKGFDEEVINMEDGYYSLSSECYCRFNNNPYTIYVSKLDDNNELIYPNCVDSDIVSNSVIGKFVIPKGTDYYINDFGEIASSQLIWTGEGIYLLKDKLLNSKETLKISELCVGE